MLGNDEPATSKKGRSELHEQRPKRCLARIITEKTDECCEAVQTIHTATT